MRLEFTISHRVIASFLPRPATQRAFELLYGKYCALGRPGRVSVPRCEVSSDSGAFELGVAELAHKGIITEIRNNHERFTYCVHEPAILKWAARGMVSEIFKERPDHEK